MEILQLAIGCAGVFCIPSADMFPSKRKKGGGFGRCWTPCGCGGTMNDALVGQKESCIRLASPHPYFFFLMLHHLEPNRAMWWWWWRWVGSYCIWQSPSAMETGHILSLCDYSNSVDLAQEKHRKPVVNHGPVCLCCFHSTISVLIWLPLCTRQMWH